MINHRYYYRWYINNIDKSLPTKIGIEGYSFSSNGAIIDLVTFSTL
jgi:hypothetical protein